MVNWTWSDTPTQAGKIVLITGANQGLGLSLAKSFLDPHRIPTEKQPAKVFICSRSLAKAEEAIKGSDVLRPHYGEGSSGRLEVLELDLADQAKIRAAAAELKTRVSRLDCLVPNAGLFLQEGGGRLSLRAFALHQFGLGPVAQGGRRASPCALGGVDGPQARGAQDRPGDDRRSQMGVPQVRCHGGVHGGQVGKRPLCQGARAPCRHVRQDGEGAIRQQREGAGHHHEQLSGFWQHHVQGRWLLLSDPRLHAESEP
mmetsp:Transcript_54217/g.170466  ORF Transcript_54217/g.170466 Transcript_54217/m.170466 type:complete len:257 (+) Transcript_54217:94-864(+)